MEVSQKEGKRSKEKRFLYLRRKEEKRKKKVYAQIFAKVNVEVAAMKNCYSLLFPVFRFVNKLIN